ncbi:hypothetical protein E8E13_004725 [Curvularia kusanoi]|uniref:Mid2 domain-containing protein n=1 Tax=Curvularia kusanoi TaxID=90978 RepID=A0A9P4TGR8_CURKU|nr:hypothetical protein E8E13_004725 [Curvularia kusanoi]
MGFLVSVLLTFLLVSAEVWCQTVQDDWTAPAAPDGSTPLQSGSRFTLLWKPTLQNNFATYCPDCDTRKLDLWITEFNGTKYQSKIGRGINLTSSVSYDWNVQIASSAFSEKDFFVFRFTFFDSTDPYTQQISSPGFNINGLIKAVSTTSLQSSSTPASSSFSSFATSSSTTSVAPTSAANSSSSVSQATGSISGSQPASKSNVWIAGVVVGPIVGIGLGAVLMWFCLRKRKNQKAQKRQEAAMNPHNGWDQHQQYSDGQAPVEKYSNTVESDRKPWQHQMDSQQYVAEAPDRASPTQPAELWHGNYRS